jgi:hypothetical protein
MGKQFNVGNRVVGGKDPYLGRYGYVRGLQGSGHGRRWLVEWDSSGAIESVHARSLELAIMGENPPPQSRPRVSVGQTIRSSRLIDSEGSLSESDVESEMEEDDISSESSGRFAF